MGLLGPGFSGGAGRAVFMHHLYAALRHGPLTRGRNKAKPTAVSVPVPTDTHLAGRVAVLALEEGAERGFTASSEARQKFQRGPRDPNRRVAPLVPLRISPPEKGKVEVFRQF